VVERIRQHFQALRIPVICPIQPGACILRGAVIYGSCILLSFNSYWRLWPLIHRFMRHQGIKLLTIHVVADHGWAAFGSCNQLG
jgi:hypothetical protein